MGKLLLFSSHVAHQVSLNAAERDKLPRGENVIDAYYAVEHNFELYVKTVRYISQYSAGERYITYGPMAEKLGADVVEVAKAVKHLRILGGLSVRQPFVIDNTAPVIKSLNKLINKGLFAI